MKALSDTAGPESAAYGEYMELYGVDLQLRRRLDAAGAAREEARRRVQGA